MLFVGIGFEAGVASPISVITIPNPPACKGFVVVGFVSVLPISFAILIIFSFGVVSITLVFGISRFSK